MFSVSLLWQCWQILQWTLFVFVVLGAGSVIVTSLRVGISPMPSSAGAIEAMLEWLPAEQEGVVVEAGCGWGSLLFSLSRKAPHCEVIGLECSFVPWLFCRLRLLFGSNLRVRIERCDFFQRSLGDAGVIVCYLFPGGMQKLGQKLIEECRPGTLVISNTFGIRGWVAEEEKVLGDLFGSRLYLYKVPESIQHET